MNINKPNRLVMEAKNFIRIFFLLSFSAVLMLASCVKEGPMGLPGIDGVDGADGTHGQDGSDGTASCVSCHNKTKQATITTQLAGSSHGTMPARQTGANCVACHSAEGFIESLTNVSTKSFTALTNPSAMNCEACHTSHKTFDFANDGPDYALRTTAKVPLFMNASVVLDFGTSNLCVNCHQPRSLAPMGSADVVVANNRFGPHYGNQSVVLEGLWGYHHPQGTTPIPAAGSHAHRKNASCTSCHMKNSSNVAVGGHTWEIGPDACKSCHSTITTKEAITASKAEYYALFNELGAKLLAIGALRTTATGGLEPNHPKTWPVNVAGSLFNYRMLYGDHSGGIHNPAYAKALLKNSIEALN
jgi:hypothetical protein